MDKIISFDKQFLIYLNNLGSEPFDRFWVLITNQLYWIPLFLVLFYLLINKIGWKNFGVVVIFMAIMIIFTDQTANFFKNHFQRLRPCFEPDVMDKIRIGLKGGQFSFYSGHATNSMAFTFFMFLILKRYYNYTFLLFFFPLIFAYSRIYLGLHYPADIIVGYFFGIFYASIFYSLFKVYEKKYFSKDINL